MPGIPVAAVDGEDDDAVMEDAPLVFEMDIGWQVATMLFHVPATAP